MTIFPKARETRESIKRFPSLKAAFPRETGKQLGVSPGKGNLILTDIHFPSLTFVMWERKGGVNTLPPSLSHAMT